MDHAAATPLSKEVLARMHPFFCADFGNPSAIHQEGVRTRKAIEEARTELAKVLHVRPQGITFTGSGTESNNLALLGRIAHLHKEGVAYSDMEIISTRIEHPSITETLAHAKSLGVTVTLTPVDADGRIDLPAFTKALTRKTICCTFAYANSEIGVIQPVGKLSRIVREKEKEYGVRIYVHVDAAQAPLYLPCELQRLGVDLLSLDAGKCYGPKGIGVLARTHDVVLSPIYFGGEQEGGLRPGTESPALIVGACTAIIKAQKQHETNRKKICVIRDSFIQYLLPIDGLVLNGHATERIANNINISIPGLDSEFAVIALDQLGIACSTKSACGGAKGQGSEVVRIISEDESRARSTIRFTLGLDTTIQEVLYVSKQLETHVTKMRAFSARIHS